MFNLFKPSPKYWITPGGPVYTLYEDMAAQPHLLVAGATGSGKSVVINGIISTLIHDSPARAQLILIDSKRVELLSYQELPHTVRYATEPDTIAAALADALKITDQRYKGMAAQRQRKYDGPALCVIIDELADLMTTQRKTVQPLIQRLCQIGRAANVHVIAATQCPLASVIPTAIGVNFDCRVGLRTRNAQDSRNILGRTGCEKLPRYGQAYYMTPDGLQLWNVPMIPDSEINALVSWWTSRQCVA